MRVPPLDGVGLGCVRVAGDDLTSRFGSAGPSLPRSPPRTSEDPEAILFDVSGMLSQKVGRGSVEGFFGAELLTPCDGTSRPWNAEVVGNGKFAGGKGATVAFAFGCDALSCGEGYAEATVQLLSLIHI